MYKEIVIKKLEEFLRSYTAISSIDYSSDIMAEPLLLSDRDAASFFLDIEREFKVDLNKLMPDLIVYSLEAIADKLSALCRDNNVCCV
jgi:hypothetical protein